MFSRHSATSRRFRHQRAGVNACSLVRVQVRAAPITAVYGRVWRSAFRRSARAAPLWPGNGPLRARTPPHGRLTAVGLGKPRRSPWAAIWRDFRGRGRPPRPACAQTQALAPPFPARGWWASCQGAARRLLARPSKGAFFDTPHDGPGRGAERGICVRFTRLGNLCRGYSITRTQNGTGRRRARPRDKATTARADCDRARVSTAGSVVRTGWRGALNERLQSQHGLFVAVPSLFMALHGLFVALCRRQGQGPRFAARGSYCSGTSTPARP